MRQTRFKLAGTLAGLFLTLAAPPAEAQRTLGLGAFLGYSKASDSSQGALHVGAALETRPFSILGFRWELGYRKDEVDVSGGADADITFIPILASAQVFPLGERAISPYLIGGGGWHITRYRVRADIDGERRTFTDLEAIFGYHVGAGLDFNLGENLTVGGDLRWVAFDVELAEIDEKTEADAIWITTGITFYF